MIRRSKPADRNVFVIPVFTPHFGCPHRCIFCDQHVISGTGHDILDAPRFRHRVDTFLRYRKNPGVFTEIAFFGGTFLGQSGEDIRRLLTLAAEYVEKGAIDGIRFSTRPDTIDDENMGILSEFPVTTVELGVQTMDDRVLKTAHRGHSASDTTQAVARLAGIGTRIGLQLMVGLPLETTPSALDSARKAAALNPDFVRIYPALVLENSLLARWFRSGRFRPLSLAEAVSVVKAQYAVFHKRGIAVARMGLQSSPALDDPRRCIAGPYHPAFGHLVLSAAVADKIRGAILARSLSGNRIAITVHPRNDSRVRGMKNEFIGRLKRHHGVDVVRIQTDKTLSMDDVRVAVA